MIVGGLFLLSSFQSSIDVQSRLALGTTDIFTHFNKLGEINKLPAFEDLEKMALQLFRGYTSSRAQHRAMHDPNGESEWSKVVPPGTKWTGPIAEDSSADIGITSKKPRAPKATKAPAPPQESSATVGAEPPKAPRKKRATPVPEKEEPEEDFAGDRVLARSIAFMREAMWAREIAYAVADGDAGRMYEILKVSTLVVRLHNV